MSPSQAFKHCPGDVLAHDVSEKTLLQPSDKIIFKGGVYYRGSINVIRDGAPQKHIVYDGNSEGSFGVGMAIIDGSEKINNWKRGEDVLGLESYYTELASNVNGYHLNLYQGNKKVILAQAPQPQNYYRIDDINEYYELKSDLIKRGFIDFSNDYNTLSNDDWSGVRLLIRGRANRVYDTKAITFDLVSKIIQYEPVPLGTKGDLKYAIRNHISALDSTGEYYYEKDKSRIHYLPYSKFSPKDSSVTFSKRAAGFIVKSSFVTIKHFILQKHIGDESENYSGVGIAIGNSDSQVESVTASGNEVRFNSSFEQAGAVLVRKAKNIKLSGNNIHHNYPNRGILVLNSTQAIVERNELSNLGGTGIALFHTVNSKVLNNQISTINGIHANGISLYLASNHNLVYKNHVSDGNAALTTKASYDLTIAFNVFESSKDTYTVSDWGGGGQLSYYNNLVLNEYQKAFQINESSIDGLNVINNIIDGSLIKVKGGNISHNVYTSLSWLQQKKRGWKLGVGEKYIKKEQVLTQGKLMFPSVKPSSTEALKMGKVMKYKFHGERNVDFIGPNKK